MSKIEILKNRIDTSLTKLNDVLNDYEKIAIKRGCTEYYDQFELYKNILTFQFADI